MRSTTFRNSMEIFSLKATLTLAFCCTVFANGEMCNWTGQKVQTELVTENCLLYDPQSVFWSLKFLCVHLKLKYNCINSMWLIRAVFDIFDVFQCL